MILSSVRRAYVVNEVSKVANNFGLTFIEGQSSNRTYDFVLSGNNINYLIIVIAGTGNNSDLVTFKDMNSGSFLRVSLNNYEQLTQFISLIFINYLVSGESMCKVAKTKGWKRNHVDILAYGCKMVIHKNVLQQAMIRNIVNVVNAEINREGKLIIKE